IPLPQPPFVLYTLQGLFYAKGQSMLAVPQANFQQGDFLLVHTAKRSSPLWYVSDCFPPATRTTRDWIYDGTAARWKTAPISVTTEKDYPRNTFVFLDGPWLHPPYDASHFQDDFYTLMRQQEIFEKTVLNTRVQQFCSQRKIQPLEPPPFSW